jgi:site-specific recombinase XerC
MNQLVAIKQLGLPTLVAAAGEHASMRFLEFFAANIRNPHTRRAYYRAVEEFLAWCASAGVPSITAVQPVHVATWIEASTRELAAPSVKQRLAAIRHLFDWLVTGQVVPVNPAGSVRGPRHKRLQARPLQIESFAVAGVAPSNELVEEAAIGLERVKLARAAWQ